MRSSVLIASAGLALSAGTALADFGTEYQMGTPTLVSSWKIGNRQGAARFDNPLDPPGSIKIYDMEDDPIINPGAVDGTFNNGGASLQGANTITRLVADDAQTISYPLGSAIGRFYFSVANNNGVAISARPRVRFWLDASGTNPAPGATTTLGNYLNYGTVGSIGFSFNPISFAANSLNLFYTNLPVGLGTSVWPLQGTQCTIWLGMTFDNNNGGTGATAAQMNLLGQVTIQGGATPNPIVGTSTDKVFRTAAAGSHFQESIGNPALNGTIINLAAGTNTAWELIALVPAPSSAALLGLGGLVAARRRRS